MVAKRLGVGATPAAAGASENVSEDWTKSIKKQILNVGRKRRHDNIYGAEDDDDDNAADDNSSSDEEEGRTTAVKERKKKKKIVTVSTDASSLVVQDNATSNDDTKSKKKKKKGKKERAQEKEAMQNDSAESTKEGDVAASSSTPSSDKEQTTYEETEKPSQKRKRPKVRSRQKNIAKDNRAANNKPSHLVLGRDDYAGRSMTQRTREKLGLGKSKSSMKSSKKSVKLDNAFEKGEWVDEDGLKEEGKPTSSSGPDEPKSSSDDAVVGESVESSKEEGSLKKIGDCIVDYEPSSSSAPAKKKKKKDKKMKKKKYKNV